ncbi:PREDICTED: tctex1 domain-containing protein 1-like [Acropora digitifera]|uniref:tctex1 domain-containing protein 1-like n=1 Tax=Acropora digitifera TaxID=70779 RepID=UPI00077AA942|nr:PREDICTED: tctex1 domain-containing protein 1-like [Acropora digitifera]
MTDSGNDENNAQKPATLVSKQRRSSLFDVGFSVHRDRGSSIISVPSVVPSQIHAMHHKDRYENTYKMQPDKRFHLPEVKEIMDETLSSSLKDVKYDPIKCKTLSKTLSHTICERVKLLGFTRFKIVCVVNIGEIKGQDVRVASRFLWDEKNDNWVDSVFVSSELFGVAVLFAVYQE